MFHQYKFIAQEHHVALESALRNHPARTTPKIIAKLYELADSRLRGETLSEQGYSCSAVKDTDSGVVIGTATQELTGIYVQLVSVKGGPRRLTAGAKWIVETTFPDGGRTNVNFY